MSQLRERVEARLGLELDRAHIYDTDLVPARTRIANPAVTLAVSAYQEEVETWLREWRSHRAGESGYVEHAQGEELLSAMLEDFRS